MASPSPRRVDRLREAFGHAINQTGFHQAPPTAIQDTRKLRFILSGVSRQLLTKLLLRQRLAPNQLEDRCRLIVQQGGLARERAKGNPQVSHLGYA